MAALGIPAALARGDIIVILPHEVQRLLALLCDVDFIPLLSQSSVLYRCEFGAEARDISMCYRTLREQHIRHLEEEAEQRRLRALWHWHELCALSGG